MKIHEGIISGEGKRFAIVVSRYNNFISDRLVEGCLDCLKRHKTDQDSIEIFKTPGAFEIPIVVKAITKPARPGEKFDAIICLGAIIRGETPHFDYIASQVTKGILSCALDQGIPVAFGIITSDSTEQAIERAGVKAGNKGFDAAMSAMEQANLFEELKSD